MTDDKQITTDKDNKVVSIKEKFKLITGKVTSVVTCSDPTIHLDDRTLIRAFMQSDLHVAFSKLHPEKKWITWSRTSTGFNITLFENKDAKDDKK